MKKFYLFSLIALISTSLMGQTYYSLASTDVGLNPGLLNNDAEQPTGSGWTSVITSTSTDQWSPNQAIPFPFQFAGVSESSFKISNTGVLTFNTSATTVPSSSNVALPTTSIPDKSVCVWGLNISGGNDNISSKVFGDAPHRQLWVRYASASHSNLTGASQWTYWAIVLEETSNRIYVVDQRTYDSGGGNVALTVGVQVSASDATSVAGSPAVQSNTTATSGNGSDPSDNTYYEFGVGSLKTTNMSAVAMDIPEYAGLNTPLQLNTMFKNRGTATVGSFTFNYSVNGGTPVSSNVSTTINSGGYELASGGTWTPSAAGNYTLKVWADNINGSTDMDNSDDTLTYNVTVAQTVARNLLAEEFSSSTCPPCKSWNDNVYNAALANYNSGSGKLVVKYQVPIPTAGDPSHNADGDARRAYYGVNAAPTMLLNGEILEYSAATWADAATEYAAFEAQAASEAAFVEIKNAVADYDGQGGTSNISVTADIESNIDLTSGDYRAQVVVMQKEYTFTNAQNGDINYHHVMRKMLPSPTGISLNISAGGSQAITASHNGFTIGAVSEFSYTLWDHNIEVMIFVENTATQKILNAQMATINLIGINEEQVLTGVEVFPQPAQDNLFIVVENNKSFDVTLTDMMGRPVYSGSFDRMAELSTAQFAAGVYSLTIESEGKLAQRKINIVH